MSRRLAGAALALEPLLVAVLVAAVSAVLGRAALQGYDAFDMSGFMDAGYRVYSGQRPYVDFYYIAGPVHLYLHALSYAVFGFTKTAVLAHLLVVNALVFCAVYVLARRELGLPVAALLAVLASLSFAGPIAHPWYDQNATLWLVLGLLVFEIPHADGTRALVKGLAMGALAGLAFLTKANVGAAGGLAFFLALLVSPWRRSAITGYVLGVVTSVTLVLATVAPLDFVYQAFIAYRAHGRLTYTFRLWQVARETPYLLLSGLAVALAGVGGREFVARHLPRLVLLGGLLFTSFFAAWTGSMEVPANITLAGVEVTYLVLLARRLPAGPPGTTEHRLHRTAVGGLLAMAVLLLVSAAEKTSARRVWAWKRSNLVHDYTLETAAMRGWRCNRVICEGIDRSVAWINTHVPPGESLFVFPDATVIYGLTGRPSYRKAPFIFHLGQGPAPGPLYEEFRAHFTSAPPEWILLHNQTEVVFYNTLHLLRWLDLDRFIEQRYRVVWHWSDFAMLRLGDGRPAPPGGRVTPPVSGAR